MSLPLSRPHGNAAPARARFLDACSALFDALATPASPVPLAPSWLSERDAAAHCGISPRALGDARRRGELAGVRVARRYTYAVGALDGWLASRAESHAPTAQTDAADVVALVAAQARARFARKAGAR